MLLVAAFMLAFGLLLAVTVKLWRGDGRTDLRRCPRCWYDMSANEALTCPECGFTARSVIQLRRPRRVAKLWIRGVGVLWVLLLLVLYFLLPGPWTTKVPRPLLAMVLAAAAPPPTPPAAGSPNGLPLPDPILKDSRSAWDRLVWDHQASIALQAWADSVLAGSGPISSRELAQLVPLADQAHNIFAQFGGTAHDEGISITAMRSRLAQARNTATDPSIKLRYEWSLSELQFEGGDYGHRPDFAWEPDAIILQALEHPDAAVRIFGLQRFSRRIHRVVVTPASPMPPGRNLVEAIASSDPDATTRQLARFVLDYTDGFLPRK
jgi:hypothetical protein